MIIEVGKYRIIPSEGHRDYGIWEYRTITANKGRNKGKTRVDWVHMGKYAGSLEVALMLVYELNLKAEKPEEIIGLAEAIKAARAIKNEIIAAVERVNEVER